MLHLKSVETSKTQLLVRAETNLGNILLNILVNDKMNIIKRKNNLQFVCVPNPAIPGKHLFR
jgi:nuclear pore complex protein Nup50